MFLIENVNKCLKRRYAVSSTVDNETQHRTMLAK